MKTRYNLRTLFYNLKTELTRHLESSALNPFTLGLVKALVLGNRSDIDKEFYQDLKDSGGAHLIALSGLHIGILASVLGFLLWPLRKIRNGAYIHFLSLAAGLMAYIYLAGASASVVRAGIMWSFLSYSILLQRQASSLNALFSSAFILLLVHPAHLFDIGFQLSYSAVFGILIMYPLFSRVTAPKNAGVRFLRSLITISLSAQLFTAPLTLFYFQQFPASFLLTNIILTPIIILFLIASYLVTVFITAGILEAPLAGLLNQMAGIMKKLTHYFHLDYTVWQTFSEPDLTLVFLMYLLLGILVSACYSRKYLILVPLGILFIQCWYINDQLQVTRENLVVYHQYRKSTIEVTLNDNSILHHYEWKPNGTTRKWSPHYFKVGNKVFLVVDTHEFEFQGLPKGVVILLSNAPRINLDRALGYLEPSMVIADGSSYPELITRWKLSCRQKNIPFHYTGEKGYYILNR